MMMLGGIWQAWEEGEDDLDEGGVCLKHVENGWLCNGCIWVFNELFYSLTTELLLLARAVQH